MSGDNSMEATRTDGGRGAAFDREPVLEIRDLSVTFAAGRMRQQRGRGPDAGAGAPARAVRELSLIVLRGEVLAIVGESGSGKSVTSRAVLGLAGDWRPGASGTSRPVAISGSILFDGLDLVRTDEAQIREIRGRHISMIFQEPGRHLNPSMTIGAQIAETIRAHASETDHSPLEVRVSAQVAALLAEVGLPERVARRYPHELSGGMKQRAMIAIAVSCNPDLLLADEPVTALDVTVQQQILRLLLELRNRHGMAVIFVSHDLAVVRSIADRIAVMYSGKIVELGPRETVFDRALHPYTQLLLRAIPDPRRRGSRLAAIPGAVPDASRVPDGCAFHPRCPLAQAVCETTVPPLVDHGSGHQAACHFAGKRTP